MVLGSRHLLWVILRKMRIRKGSTWVNAPESFSPVFQRRKAILEWRREAARRKQGFPRQGYIALGTKAERAPPSEGEDGDDAKWDTGGQRAGGPGWGSRRDWKQKLGLEKWTLVARPFKDKLTCLKVIRLVRNHWRFCTKEKRKRLSKAGYKKIGFREVPDQRWRESGFKK